MVAIIGYLQNPLVMFLWRAEDRLMNFISFQWLPPYRDWILRSWALNLWPLLLTHSCFCSNIYDCGLKDIMAMSFLFWNEYVLTDYWTYTLLPKGIYFNSSYFTSRKKYQFDLTYSVMFKHISFTNFVYIRSLSPVLTFQRFMGSF